MKSFGEGQFRLYSKDDLEDLVSMIQSDVALYIEGDRRSKAMIDFADEVDTKIQQAFEDWLDGGE